MTQTSEPPKRPRPGGLARDEGDLEQVVGAIGGREAAARSGEAEVVSSSSSIRLSAPVSSSLATSGSGTVAPRSGERYIGRRSVFPDSPHGPTFRFVTR